MKLKQFLSIIHKTMPANPGETVIEIRTANADHRIDIVSMSFDVGANMWIINTVERDAEAPQTA